MRSPARALIGAPIDPSGRLVSPETGAACGDADTLAAVNEAFNIACRFQDEATAAFLLERYLGTREAAAFLEYQKGNYGTH